MEIKIFNLILVLFVAWMGGALATRLKYPAILGELLAGIVFGPPILGLLQINPALDVLAHFGVFLMMLYIGMEINLRDLQKASFGGLLAAVGGFICPMFLGYWLVIWLGGTQAAGLFLGVAMGVTSLATKSRILLDLKLLGTRIAHVMLAGAVMTDTAALVIFAAIIGIAGAKVVSLGEIALVAGKALLFFGAAFLVGIKLLPFLGRQMARAGFNQRTTNFSIVLMVGLLFAEMAELGGLHSILGAFFAGLFLREGVFERKLSRDVSNLVHDISIGFLAPIFFVTAGFQVSLSVFQTDLLMLISVIVVATVAKILGTALFYLPSKNGWREGIAIGAGMNGRGAVEIIMAQIGLEYGIISRDIFSILVFMAFFTTMTVPLFLKWSIDWLRRRNELVEAEDDREGVILIGAGPLARRLAHFLGETQPVWLIDSNKIYCKAAQDEGLNVINGNALEEEVLAQANAEKVRLMIALTPNQQINVLTAQLGRKEYWIPRVYAYQSARYQWMYQILLSDIEVNVFDLGKFDLTDWDRWIQNKRVKTRKVAVTEPVPAREWLKRHAKSSSLLPLGVAREGVRLFFPLVETLSELDTVYGLEVLEPDVVIEDEFDHLLKEADVLDIMDAIDYRDCFKLISRALAQRTGMAAGELEHAFYDRERLSSTVLAPGLAIPHLILEGEGIFHIVVLRCCAGVRFSAEAPGVHTIFALAGSVDMRRTHLRALSAIAQIVQNPEFENQWLAAEGVREMRKLLLTAERKRFSEA